MKEINLLEDVPKTNRKIEEGWRTEENKIIARRYDKEFFDGERVNGYGGYYYDGRWRKVVQRLKELYKIDSESAVLDIGCAKGFLLYDLQEMISGIKVAGFDISEYSINHALDKFGIYTIKQKTGKQEDELIQEELEQAREIEKKAKAKILPFMIQASAEKLPWPDNSFDLVLAINTIHNLPEEKCKKAIQEMMRVCKPGGHMFIQVDSYKNEEQKKRMLHWILTAEIMKSNDEWIDFFKKIGYNGDFFWTIF